ncbi:MAG TPA: DNA alkylation repair protein [Sandaracinaceae bacterium LLY-WYZ-13_1]|nr:DNA alkylation repair protein [Sandaracinaceae bacterium LLY-WYZ-13_1]
MAAGASGGEALVARAMTWIDARRDPEKAASMARYLKIVERADPSRPLGVPKGTLRALCRELKRDCPPADEGELWAQIGALWAQPYREPKYVALEHARAFRRTCLTPASLPRLERWIVEGAWWDLVDGIAGWLVSPLYRRARAEVRPTLDRWRDSDDRWLRRSVLLAHLGHREDTDEAALFADVAALTSETDFFLRKAVGWVLRDYSYAAPERVRRYLLAHRDELSRLSFREGAKRLVRVGAMEGSAGGA